MSDLVGNLEDRFSHSEAHIIWPQGVVCLEQMSCECLHDNTEPRCEKTSLRDFRPGLTQTGLYCSHRRGLEAWNFGFRKYRNCSVRVAETKALISLAVTASSQSVLVSNLSWKIVMGPQFKVSSERLEKPRIKTHNPWLTRWIALPLHHGGF